MFCRETGWNEDDDAVDARDGVCSMTDMLTVSIVVGDEAFLDVRSLLLRLLWRSGISTRWSAAARCASMLKLNYFGGSDVVESNVSRSS